MANNQKKKAKRQFKKRQAQKQQRRNERKKRQQPSSNAMRPAIDQSLYDLPLNIAPDVLMDFGDGDIMAVMQAAWDTDELWEEPEFDTLEIQPIEVAGVFMRAADKLGLGPDEGADNDRMGEAFEKTIEQVLTPALKEQLITATTALRTRARAANERHLLKKAAALQFALSTDLLEHALTDIGLLRTLVSQNIDAGFALLGLAVDAEETEEGLSPAEKADELVKQLSSAEQDQSILDKVEENLALQRYMERQVEEMNQRGGDALLGGELQLDLYTPAELTALSKQMIAVWEAASATETPAADAENAVPLTEAADDEAGEDVETVNIFMPEILALVNSFIEEQLTAARVAAIGDTLNGWLADPQHHEHELYNYVATESRMLAEDDGVNSERYFLIMALFGELRPYLLERDDDRDDEDTAAVEAAAAEAPDRTAVAATAAQPNEEAE